MRLREIACGGGLCEYRFQTTEFCGKVEANTLAKLVYCLAQPDDEIDYRLHFSLSA